MSHDHPLWTLADKLQMDARQMAATIVELRAQLAALELDPPGRHACSRCRMSFRSAAKLAEHLYVSHDGPEPDHYAAADRLAAPPTEEEE